MACDIIVKERMARRTRQIEARSRSAFPELDEGLGLGVADRGKIEVADVKLG